MKNGTSLISKRDRKFFKTFFGVMLAAFLISTLHSQYNPFELLLKSDALWSFLWEDFIPPVVNNPLAVVSAIAVTLSLAVVSTFIAMTLSFFTAVYASTRTAPKPRIAKYVRAIVTVMRNIPALIWAYILFSALGIGTGVALVALIISSFAFLTRAFVEVIDELPESALEPLSACGCTFWQKVFHCVLPNCIPDFLEWLLYCVELNIRSSTIVGMVGGGGIGLVLFTFIKSFNYHAAAGIILIIAFMVIAVEWIMNCIRRKVSASYKIIFSAWGALCVASLFVIDADWGKLLSRIPRIAVSLGRLIIFDFDRFPATLAAFGESVAMTVLATIYSAILGLLFGALMSRLVVRNRLINILIAAAISFVRAVPSVIWVLLVLVCIGFGPATGIVGLGFHSLAFFAKAFAQSFDDIGSGVVEALKATGANRLQIFFTGILPAVLSSVVAWFSLRFEVNFADSTVLGMVGAGGIGFVISANIQNYKYGRAGVAIFLVILFAYGVEMFFSRIKKKYLMNE